MTDKKFLKIVREGMAQLSPKIQAMMENVAVVVESDLSPSKRAEMGLAEGEELFGLYEGVPRTERGSDYAALPDKITIFKNTVLATYTDEADIKECVANTVWHEIAHHFGYDDEWIEKEELRRGKGK